MFLNSYRRRLGAVALMRGIVTGRRWFGDESGGSADDQLNGIASGGGARCLYPAQPTGVSVPTGEVLVRHSSLALRASFGWHAASFPRRRRLSAVAALSVSSEPRTRILQASPVAQTAPMPVVTGSRTFHPMSHRHLMAAQILCSPGWSIVAAPQACRKRLSVRSQPSKLVGGLCGLDRVRRQTASNRLREVPQV